MDFMGEGTHSNSVLQSDLASYVSFLLDNSVIYRNAYLFKWADRT